MEWDLVLKIMLGLKGFYIKKKLEATNGEDPTDSQSFEAVVLLVLAHLNSKTFIGSESKFASYHSQTTFHLFQRGKKKKKKKLSFFPGRFFFLLEEIAPWAGDELTLFFLNHKYEEIVPGEAGWLEQLRELVKSFSKTDS